MCMLLYQKIANLLNILIYFGRLCRCTRLGTKAKPTQLLSCHSIQPILCIIFVRTHIIRGKANNILRIYIYCRLLYIEMKICTHTATCFKCFTLLSHIYYMMVFDFSQFPHFTSIFQ